MARFKRLQSVIESGALEIDAEEIGEGQTNDFLRDIYELRKRQKAAIRNSGEGANGGGHGDEEEMSGTKREKDKDKEVPFEDLCDEEKIKVFFKRFVNNYSSLVPNRCIIWVINGIEVSLGCLCTKKCDC